MGKEGIHAPDVRRIRLSSSPSVVLQHLKVLRPPDYADLVPLASRDVDEGSIICVDVLADSPAVVRFIDQHISRSHLAQICRHCPCVLLAPTDGVRDVLRAFHSRPLLRGFRAVLVPGMPWRDVLREVLTEERSLAQDLAAWTLFERPRHRLDREILETIFSLSRDVSLVKGLQPVASISTVATHLTHLCLPPASRLKTLGLAVRAVLRLQREP
jgi:hypothetical protein